MWATNWDTGFVLVILCSPFVLERATGKHTHTHPHTNTHTHTSSPSTQYIWILLHSYVMLISCSVWPLNQDTIFIPLPVWLPAWQSLYTASRDVLLWRANNGLNGITMADQFKLMRVGTMVELLLHLSLRYAVCTLVELCKRYCMAWHEVVFNACFYTNITF